MGAAAGETLTGAEVAEAGVRLITGPGAPAGWTVGARALPLAEFSLMTGAPGAAAAGFASTLGLGGPSTSLVGSLAAIHSRRDSAWLRKGLSAPLEANLAIRPS